MSYDLTIWCTEPFDDPSLLPKPEKWTVEGRGWTYETRNWHVQTGPSDRVLEEDIPDEVTGLMPGIQYVVHASLSPVGASKAGQDLLRRFARVVAKHSRGVIVDERQGTVELPRGLKRYVRPKRAREEPFALLTMSWWMAHDRLLHEEGLDEFLHILATLMPDAMPRRYGRSEPPKHIFAETGPEHLRAFLREHLGRSTVVWRPHAPVSTMHFSIRPDVGWQRLGGAQKYRCNRVQISFEHAALTQPGWSLGLDRLWRALSVQLRPFYGDVRTLRGYTERPGQPISVADTDCHPVTSWWWMGVPPKLGHAVVVGEPYLALWPGLRKGTDIRVGLAFASTSDWAVDGDVSERFSVPESIALPVMSKMEPTEFGGWSMTAPETYPPQFPFGPLPEGARTIEAVNAAAVEAPSAPAPGHIGAGEPVDRPAPDGFIFPGLLAALEENLQHQATHRVVITDISRSEAPVLFQVVASRLVGDRPDTEPPGLVVHITFDDEPDALERFCGLEEQSRFASNDHDGVAGFSVDVGADAVDAARLASVLLLAVYEVEVHQQPTFDTHASVPLETQSQQQLSNEALEPTDGDIEIPRPTEHAESESADTPPSTTARRRWWEFWKR